MLIIARTTLQVTHCVSGRGKVNWAAAASTCNCHCPIGCQAASQRDEGSCNVSRPMVVYLHACFNESDFRLAHERHNEL